MEMRLPDTRIVVNLPIMGLVLPCRRRGAEMKKVDLCGKPCPPDAMRHPLAQTQACQVQVHDPPLEALVEPPLASVGHLLHHIMELQWVVALVRMRMRLQLVRISHVEAEE